MSDEDEFDPSAAAAVALGEQADGDLDLADGDASDPGATRPDDGDAPDGDSADETAASDSRSGAVTTFLVPLFTASESGPTAPTLQEQAGLSERISYIVDGALDYALHFSDEWADRLEDSLGPAGKFGRAFSGMLDADDSNDSDDEDRDRSSDSENDAETITVNGQEGI